MPAAVVQHIEAQIQFRGITQDVTKYFHVVAALDASTTAQAMSLLKDPPAADKYDALKAFLLRLFEDLEMLSLNGLGNGKASCLVEKMLVVLGSADPSSLFTHLFLRRCARHWPVTPSSPEG